MLFLSVAAAPDATTPTSTLDNIDTIVGTVSAIVTTLALLGGAAWAYWRFVKDRTYRPRLAVELDAAWKGTESEYVLITIAVSNIGASQVTLEQSGTGLRVDTVDKNPPDPWPPLVDFRTTPNTYEVFLDHEWIEPGERIVDHVLLERSETTQPPLRLSARLLWTWSKREHPIAVNANIIVFEEPSKQQPEEQA